MGKRVYNKKHFYFFNIWTRSHFRNRKSSLLSNLKRGNEVCFLFTCSPVIIIKGLVKVGNKNLFQMFITNPNINSATFSPASKFQTYIQQTAFATLSLGTSNSTYPKLNFTFPSLPQTCSAYCIFPTTIFLISSNTIYLVNQASNHPQAS